MVAQVIPRQDIVLAVELASVATDKFPKTSTFRSQSNTWN